MARQCLIIKGLNWFLLIQLLISIGCRPIDAVVAHSVIESQCLSELDSISGKLVYSTVDSMPEFPGGSIALVKYLMTNFDLSRTSEEFQGSFVFEFIISKEGNLVDARVKGKSIEQFSQQEQEGLRVLGSMPKWKAGICAGKPVPVLVILPLKL